MTHYFNTWYAEWDPVLFWFAHTIYAGLAVLFWFVFKEHLRGKRRLHGYTWKHAMLAIAMSVVWPITWFVALIRYTFKEAQEHDWSSPPSWMLMLEVVLSLICILGMTLGVFRVAKYKTARKNAKKVLAEVEEERLRKYEKLSRKEWILQRQAGHYWTRLDNIAKHPDWDGEEFLEYYSIYGGGSVTVEAAQRDGMHNRAWVRPVYNRPNELRQAVSITIGYTYFWGQQVVTLEEQSDIRAKLRKAPEGPSEPITHRTFRTIKV